MEVDNKKSEYGEEYVNHYFEQYKLYISSIEKISDRRESANRYFISLNSALIIAGSFLIEHISNKNSLAILLLGILFLGLFSCVIFYYLINSYKQLNTGKFTLLHRIESSLPIGLYSTEWEILGKGNDKKKYFPFSHIEKTIPFIFGLAYFCGIIFVIFKIC